MDWDDYFKSKATINNLPKINTSYPDIVYLMLKLTNKNSKCLEIGCGSGTYALELINAGRNCIASDLYESALKITKLKAKKLYGIKKVPTRVINIYNIPYNNNTFDLIFSDGVFEHLDILKALKEVKRVLKKGGWLVTKIPSDSVWYKIAFKFTIAIGEWGDEHPYFKDKEWIKKFKDAGFKEVTVRRCGNIPLAIFRRIFKSKKFDKFAPRIGKIYLLVVARK